MLQGLKFIQRDQIDDVQDGTFSDSRQGERKSAHGKQKVGVETKHSNYDSSDDGGLKRIKGKSTKKKKWYRSDEDLSSSSQERGGQSESDRRKKNHSRRRRVPKNCDNSDDEHRKLLKKKRSQRNEYSSEDEPLNRQVADGKCSEDNDNSRNNLMRKELGLDWMLNSVDNIKKASNKSSHSEPKEAAVEEIKKDNPRELNPYLKNNGIGYPEESSGVKAEDMGHTAVVGDGGASWRQKALKRAQEQAAREGKEFHHVVEERWGSMGRFAASVDSHKAAPAYAHLHATKNRKKGLVKDEHTNIDEEKVRIREATGQKSMDDVLRHKRMRVPKVDQSLSWGKLRSKKLTANDTVLASPAAVSNINKFSNDGSFMDELMHKEDKADDPTNPTKSLVRSESKYESNLINAGMAKPAGNANQLAAKAFQLRMKGKHEEADKLMREVENIRERQKTDDESRRPRIDATTSRYIMNDVSVRQKKKEEDSDLHLAQKIMHSHQYSIYNQADEEYDYDGSPRKKNRKKGERGNQRSSEITKSANRFLTQQERCAFCFENPTRPRHLVVAIGNFTYLSLPHKQPVVPGHCCILTLQHEGSTRSVDDDVWEEIRNFKKCVIMMYAKQDKEVVFMETVLQLAQQRRHLVVDCVPLPQDIAKQAPGYFKKAIDEAEEEWSQHNAKKLIDTSEKGLRASIPKNFPYFHVEFGLKRGFVHVIDDEKAFGGSFGLNVMRGILQLPAEDMHRRRRDEPVEAQKQAVASFARDWQPFDWTKQLD